MDFLIRFPTLSFVFPTFLAVLLLARHQLWARHSPSKITSNDLMPTVSMGIAVILWGSYGWWEASLINSGMNIRIDLLLIYPLLLLVTGWAFLAWYW